MFRKKIKSPVKQEIIWLAEYADGTYLTEFDLNTQKPNKLDMIRKTDIIRFGLVGIDVPVYYEVYGGYFNVAGRGIQVRYEEDGKEYYLIGQNKPYNNFLSIKRGESVLNFGDLTRDVVAWGKNAGQIIEHTFGYRENLEVNGVKFIFEALCTIPYQKPVFMTFKLIADKDMDGKLVIMRNGKDFTSIEAPLKVGELGETSWMVR